MAEALDNKLSEMNNKSFEGTNKFVPKISPVPYRFRSIYSSI